MAFNHLQNLHSFLISLLISQCRRNQHRVVGHSKLEVERTRIIQSTSISLFCCCCFFKKKIPRKKEKIAIYTHGWYKRIPLPPKYIHKKKKKQVLTNNNIQHRFEANYFATYRSLQFVRLPINPPFPPTTI